MKRKDYLLKDFINEQEKKNPGFKKKVAKEVKRIKKKEGWE